ncbi:hypothetical protein TWF718_002060 [Orbilia javanica]|uniref:Uncharacterized protein n=1 Tax=Orbilia javanica TaxID=47235 RepID=A0AAN8N9H0_9PEZI
MDCGSQNSVPFEFPFSPATLTNPSIPISFVGAAPAAGLLSETSPGLKSLQNTDNLLQRDYLETLANQEWSQRVDGEFQKLDDLVVGLFKDVNNSARMIFHLRQQGKNSQPPEFFAGLYK